MSLPYATLAQHANTVRKTGTSNDEAFLATFQWPQFGLATPYQKQNAKTEKATMYTQQIVSNHIKII